MNFEYMFGLSTQDRTPDQFNRNAIYEMTHVGHIDSTTLRDAVERMFPGKNAAVMNDEERRLRTGLSNLMQKNMTTLLMENYEAQQARKQLGLKQPRDGFPRYLNGDTLFGLDSRNISMEEYTRRHNILLNGSKADKGKLVMEVFHSVKADIEAKGYNHDNLTQMTDADIVRNFEDIQKISSWQGAADSLAKSNELELSDEQKQELQDFYDEYRTSTLTYNRAKFIGSPYYGAVKAENVPYIGYSDEDNQLFKQDFLFPGLEDLDMTEQMKALGDMRNHLSWVQNFRANVLDTEVTKQLEGAYCNEIKWLDAQGKTLEPEHSSRSGEYTPPVDGLRDGQQLTALLPNGTRKTFDLEILPGGGITVRTDSQPAMVAGTNNRMSLSGYMDRHIKSSLSELSDALNKSDSWYIKSSPEFKELKSTLEQVQKSWRAMNGVPRPTEIKNLQQQMESLQAASDAYLDSKKDKEDFNPREKARFDAVKNINFFATQQLANVRTLLSRTAQPENEKERAAFDAANTPEARAARQRGAAPQYRAAHRFEQAPDRSEIRRDRSDKQLETQRFLQRMHKAKEYQLIPCPPSSGPNGDNYALQHLRDTVVCGLEPIFDAANFSKVAPEKLDKLQRNMAAVTLFHMVMTERGANFDGKAGPLEQALTTRGEENMINSIKRLPAFKDIVGKITPDRMHDFIMEDGGRQIGKQIIETIRDQNRAAQNPEPQHAAQKEKSNSMGM